MKIAAFIGMKDEIELVRDAIDHLRRIGVDHIIASDGGSRDGTAEVLEALVAEAGGEGIELMPYDDRDPETDRSIAEQALARARAAGADWLLFCDADEFWLPASGRLRDCLALAAEAAEVDVLNVARYNVPLLEAGPALPLPALPARYGALLLYAPDEDLQSRYARLMADSEASWIASVPIGKIMVRPDRVAGVGEGGHRALAAAGARLREVTPDDLLIAHMPFSTEARFARKVANIAAAVEASGDSWDPGSAWHWRRWLETVAAEGGVAAEMARNRIDPAELDRLRTRGVVRAAADLLADQASDGASDGTGDGAGDQAAGAR